MRQILWHNPRCSKSRQTLALLKENKVEPEIRLYLEDVPSVDELKEILNLLDQDPASIVRKTEAVYKELELKTADADKLLNAMANHPKLIERPVFISGDKARIGRPPENVLEIL